MNSCIFFLSDFEEMKICIYRVETANTWVRLQWIWHHLFILLLEQTVLYTFKRVCKIQIVSEICKHDPMFTLHIAGLRVDNSKSAIIESVGEPIYGKTAKVLMCLKEERPGIKEVVNHFLLRLLPPCRTFTLPTVCGSFILFWPNVM